MSSPLATTPVLMPLPDFALLEIAGNDAVAFLQSQSTNDVKALAENSFQWNGLCTNKGRLYATFPLWRQHEVLRLVLPGEMVDDVRTRLSRYILRAKVTIRATDFTLFGIANGQELLMRLGVVLPTIHTYVPWEGGALLALNESLLLAVLPSPAAARWQAQLAEHGCAPSNSHRWEWWMIQAGFPLITKATQEAFVPQMVGFDKWGVSFTKGCYPGQEVVARTHYLGKVKRHLLQGHSAQLIDAAREPLALYADDEATACGQVLLLAPAPNGGTDLLAVMKEAGWHNPLRIGEAKDAAAPKVEMALP